MAMPNIGYQMAHIQESRVPDILAACIVSLVLAISSVAIRFVARRLKHQPFLWDDWTALGSLIITIAYIGLTMSLTQWGFGKHAMATTNRESLTIGILVAQVFYSASIAFIKTSTIFLIYRIFASKSLLPWLWGVGIIVHAYSFTLAITLMFQCQPLRAMWTPELAATATCYSAAATSAICIITGTLNALTDIILLGLPMPLLWNLKMDTKRKIQVTCVFACGALVFAISVARVPFLENVDKTDASWSYVNGGIWSVLESGVGTLCACLPTFGVIFNACKERFSSQNLSFRDRRSPHDTESGNSLHKGRKSPGYSADRDMSIDSETGLQPLDDKEMRVLANNRPSPFARGMTREGSDVSLDARHKMPVGVRSWRPADLH